jgi:hypothetical protein
MIALAEKSLNEGGQDKIGIYDVTTNTWECLFHFTPDTFDLEDLRFTSDGQHIIVWDSILKCSLQIYQL